MSYESPRKKPDARPEAIELEGRSFAFVLTQRDGLIAVYKSADAYLRIGDSQKVNANLALHKKLEATGFPVPRILAEGEQGGQTYFIESSLGGKHFGDLFGDELEQKGVMSEATFDAFITLAEQFARAQLKTRSETHDFNKFSHDIGLDEMCKALPDYAEKLRARFNQAQKHVTTLPFVVTHGDFNPHNMYPTGVIDFEYASRAPYGYDLISAISHIDNFPDSPEYEYFAAYRLTDEQKQRYLERLDAISEEAGLPPLSSFKADFDFLRAVWSAGEIAHVPKLQKFRYDLLIEKFLKS